MLVKLKIEYKAASKFQPNKNALDDYLSQPNQLRASAQIKNTFLDYKVET